MNDFVESMALRFLKIDEFLDTIDKVYISRFFAIRRYKPRKTSKSGAKMHPETHQNLTKSMLEKTHIFGVDFGMILTSKMSPPRWHPCAFRGPLGAAMGPTRCLKTDLASNLAPQ